MEVWHLTVVQLAAPSCRSGPGESCRINHQYAKYVSKQAKKDGSFASACGLPKTNVTAPDDCGAATFSSETWHCCSCGLLTWDEVGKNANVVQVLGD